MSQDNQRWIAQNPFVRSLIPVAAAAGLSFTACKTSEPQKEPETKPITTQVQASEQVKKDAWKNNGKLTTEDFTDYCQRYADCDPDNFKSSYESVEDCATQREQEHNDYIQTDYQNLRDECRALLDAYQEQYLGAYRCNDGSFEVDEAMEAKTEQMLVMFETCVSTGTVQVSGDVLKHYCEGLFACEGKDTDFESVEQCMSQMAGDMNPSLAEYERYYGLDCAQAQAAYYEATYMSYSCQEGTWESADDAPSLDALEAERDKFCQ
ncbi:MAG: hypothetical protein VYE40_06565 [Myxococcota bacterium]|jgi:hypothetical protein|nr:hypothetical protein [Myxococcota bacterium]MEC9440741.1 hypothetical protein [Myxococcota bacterium]